MKKILAILMVITTMVMFSGCGGENEIQLTLDNYEDYLTIGGSCKLSDTVRDTATKEYWRYSYTCIEGELYVEPASEALLYNDVSVTIALTGELTEIGYVHDKGGYIDNRWNIYFTDTVECNIGGNGSTSILHLLEESVSTNGEIDLSYTVVGITGTITCA